MSLDKDINEKSCLCILCDYDEDHNENKPNLLWPFKSEEEEHRYFDDLQRADDFRSFC